MTALNYFNDRMRVMDLGKKQDELPQTDLDIEYQQVEKAVIGGKINKNTHKKLPPNIPEHELYPERWELYDPETKLVKPNTEVGGKFAEVEFAKFRLKENEKELLKEFLEVQIKQPGPGQYDPLSDLLEEGIAIPNFDRYLERSVLKTRQELMNTDVDGDVLILHPSKTKPKVQGDVRLDVMKGRDDNDITEQKKAEVGAEIILEKNYNQVEKKQPMMVNMNKQSERKPFIKERDETNLEDGEAFGLLYDVNYNLYDTKPKCLVNYTKNQGRHIVGKEVSGNTGDDNGYFDLGADEYIPEINNDPIKPRVKMMVKMRPPVGQKKDSGNNENK